MGRVITDLSNRLGCKFKTLVGHKNPDEDVWLGFWIAERFGLCERDVRYEFVSAGTARPGSEKDPTVLHVDTGGGEFDQHGKSLARTCSAALLAAKLGLTNDPGLKTLLEWVTAVDNAEKLPPTHIHFITVGLHRQSSCFGENNQVDWMKVKERIYEIFDMIHDQDTRRQRSRDQLPRNSSWKRLSSGVSVCSIFGRPDLRDAAFERGADVVIWTSRNGKGFYVGIAVGRDSNVRLTGVVALIRYMEAKKRGLNLRVEDLGYLNQAEPVRGWFLHDSLKLILCGSPKASLADDEYTQLTPAEIEQAVYRVL